MLITSRTSEIDSDLRGPAWPSILKKCGWAKGEVQHLGFQFQGVTSAHLWTRSKPSVMPKKQVRLFVGLVGWYSSFTSHCSTFATHCKQCFTALKNAMCSSPVLYSPDFQKCFMVQVDALDVAMELCWHKGERRDHCCISAISWNTWRPGIPQLRRRA